MRSMAASDELDGFDLLRAYECCLRSGVEEGDVIHGASPVWI
jgi:hypothetical protein